MKKIVLLLIIINIVSLGYAQESLIERISDINQKIDCLKKDIQGKYQEFCDQKLYTDEKTRNAAFDELEKEKEALQIQIKKLNHDIDSLKEEYQAIDKIREYYESYDIDSLFIHANPIVLNTHKKIFGDGYPKVIKVIDDLQILLECADLLKGGYDEAKNSSEREKLKGVQDCKAKEHLDILLSEQKDITDEVNSWIKEEKHTIYSMMTFQREMHSAYGISLDTDFPYLYGKIVEKLELTTTKE